MSERTNTKVHSLYFYLARVKFLCFMYYCGGSVFCENYLSECWGNTEEEKKKMFRRNRKGNVEKGESLQWLLSQPVEQGYFQTCKQLWNEKRCMWPADTDGVSVPEWEWLRVQEAAGDCHFGANYSATEKGIAIVCVCECLIVVMKMKGWPSPFRQTLELFQRQFGETSERCWGRAHSLWVFQSI